MNYYSFHIGDYIKQTVHLTPMEDICYRRLLDMYYETELPIPTETDRVSRRLRLDTELVDSVLKEFFTLTENGWENARCDGEINAYHVKADTARSNGKLGGRPKKTQSVSDRNPAESGSKANQEPRTKNQEPNKSTAIAVLVGSEAADAGMNSGDNGKRLPNCPHQRIVDLYGEILPEQPQPRSWEGTRAKHLQARWRWLLTATKRNGQRYATNEAEALDFFRRMFTHIRSSDFLMRQWTSWDLGWLVKAENFEKIIAGNYENREAA